MIKKHLFFNRENQKGGMLIELMMSIALAAIIIPFVFRYQQISVSRARNIAVVKQMENVQSALERYIVENKINLMKPTGKNITRIEIDDLVDYGLPEYIAQTYSNDYQLRILKSADKSNKSILQGIVILSNSDITPLRTREIVNLGGGKFGFVEGNSTYGGFGAYRINASDFGVPQNRERIIIVGSKECMFDFSRIETSPKTILANFLDESGDFEFLEPHEYTLIEHPRQQEDSGLIFAGYRNKSIRKVGVRPNTLHLSRVHKQPNRIYSVNGIHPTLPSQESSGRYFILTRDNQVRKLTIDECWRIMGFPRTFVRPSAIGEQYRQLGNSVCVPMIRSVAKEVVHQLLEEKNEETSR